MRHHVATLTLCVTLLAASIANANVVADRAIGPSVGCDSKSDLIDVLRAGHMQQGEDLKETNKRVSSVIKQKLELGKMLCYRIGTNSLLRSRVAESQ